MPVPQGGGTQSPPSHLLFLLSTATLDITDINLVEPQRPFKDGVLTESDRKLLLSMYNQIYPDSLVSQVGCMVQTCKRLALE